MAAAAMPARATGLNRPFQAATKKLIRGLSGRPLLPLANRMLAETFVRVEGVFPLVGAGGTESGENALAKIRAGASLIQIYSGLVFRGLALVTEIKSTLLDTLQRGGHDSLTAIIGVDAAAVTAESWPT